MRPPVATGSDTNEAPGLRRLRRCPLRLISSRRRHGKVRVRGCLCGLLFHLFFLHVPSSTTIMQAAGDANEIAHPPPPLSAASAERFSVKLQWDGSRWRRLSPHAAVTMAPLPIKARKVLSFLLLLYTSTEIPRSPPPPPNLTPRLRPPPHPPPFFFFFSNTLPCVAAWTCSRPSPVWHARNHRTTLCLLTPTTYALNPSPPTALCHLPPDPCPPPSRSSYFCLPSPIARCPYLSPISHFLSFTTPWPVTLLPHTTPQPTIVALTTTSQHNLTSIVTTIRSSFSLYMLAVPGILCLGAHFCYWSCCLADASAGYLLELELFVFILLPRQPMESSSRWCPTSTGSPLVIGALPTTTCSPHLRITGVLPATTRREFHYVTALLFYHQHPCNKNHKLLTNDGHILFCMRFNTLGKLGERSPFSFSLVDINMGKSHQSSILIPSLWRNIKASNLVVTRYRDREAPFPLAGSLSCSVYIKHLWQHGASSPISSPPKAQINRTLWRSPKLVSAQRHLCKAFVCPSSIWNLVGKPLLPIPDSRQSSFGSVVPLRCAGHMTTPLNHSASYFPFLQVFLFPWSSMLCFYFVTSSVYGVALVATCSRLVTCVDGIWPLELDHRVVAYAIYSALYNGLYFVVPGALRFGTTAFY